MKTRSVILDMLFGKDLRAKVWWLRVQRSWDKRANYIVKHVSLLSHTCVVLLSLVAGIALFIFITTFFLPKSLALPQTTAINWLTLNRHSMVLDYIRFGLFVFIIPSSVVIGWIVFIWQKNR